MREYFPTKSLMHHWMSMAICLGCITYSYNLVFLSQIANALQLKNNLTNNQLVFQLTIATSSFDLGTLIGSFLSTKYRSKLGELRGLLYVDCIAILCICAQVIRLDIYYLSIPRFILGIFMGISAGIIPIYINSIAPKHVSGKIGTYNQLFQVCGVILAFLMGFMLINNDKDDEYRWRICLLFSILPLIARQLLLQCLYPYDSVERMIEEEELDQMEAFCGEMYENPTEAMEMLMQTRQTSVEMDDFSYNRSRRYLIGIVVMASNQLAGINAIMFYAKQLIDEVTNNEILLTQVILVFLGLFQVASTYISGIVIDKKGRKSMLLYGYAILVVILFSIFAIDALLSKNNHGLSEILIVLLIFGHIIIFNINVGPVCIIYCTQIMEDIKWAVVTLYGGSLTMALTTDYMIQFLGVGKMFLIFACITLIIFLFLKDRLVETKGLTPKQIYPLF